MIQYSEPSILKKKVAPDIDLMSFELYVQSTPKWQQWVWVHSAGADIYKYSMLAAFTAGEKAELMVVSMLENSIL